MVCVLLAEQEDVEFPRVRTENDNADEGDWQCERDVAPSPVSQASHQPDDGFPETVAAVDEHIRNQ